MPLQGKSKWTEPCCNWDGKMMVMRIFCTIGSENLNMVRLVAKAVGEKSRKKQ